MQEHWFEKPNLQMYIGSMDVRALSPRAVIELPTKPNFARPQSDEQSSFTVNCRTALQRQQLSHSAIPAIFKLVTFEIGQHTLVCHSREWLADTWRSWLAATMAKEFECDQCGACCQGHLIVEVYALDVMREPHLATAAKPLSPEQTYETLMADLDQDGKCLVIAGVGPCKFLTETFKCAIYSTRPNVCVAMKAGDEQCQLARGAAGLEPLEPTRG